MNITIRIHEDIVLGGVTIPQGLRTIDRSELPTYAPFIFTGKVFFTLEINQFEALNLELNQQIYRLYLSDLDNSGGGITNNSSAIIVTGGEAITYDGRGKRFETDGFFITGGNTISYQ